MKSFRSTILAALMLGLSGQACQVANLFKVELPVKVGNTTGGMQTGLWRYYYLVGDAQRGGLFARGYYVKDKPDGRWTYFYPPNDAQRAAGENGSPQWEVGFEDEAFEGPTTFYYENGQVLASGAYAGARETGPWTFYAENGTKVLEGTFNQGRRTGLWKAWDSAGQPVAEGQRDEAERRGVWRFWRADGESYTVDFTQPAEAGPQPPADLLARLDARPRMPILPPPATVYEEELHDVLPTIYEREAATLEDLAPPVAGGDGPYGPASRGKKKPYDSTTSERLEGTRLPVRSLQTRDGDNVDLLEPGSRGRWLVLVVLRGMTDEVCIYCKHQTRVLAQNKPKFLEREADVILVYPGDMNRLEAFRTAYLREFLGEEPDYPILWDQDPGLVVGLGIEKDFAKPTTLIIDPDGIIRAAFVANSPEVRPSVEKILEVLDDLRP